MSSDEVIPPTEPPIEPPIIPSSEPQNPLEIFRHRAALILREQRGFSSQAAMQLEELARELAIDESIASAELAALTTAAAKPVNPALEKFRKRLTKDLSGHQRTVIGPTIEQAIIAAAQTKYSISEAEALEVLAEVAASLSLRRVTTSEAVEHFSEGVAAAAKNASWLSRDAWDRLRLSGQSWGLDEELIDTLIRERLDANRQSFLRSRRQTRVVLLGSAGLVILALTAIYLVAVMRSRNPVAATITPPTETAPATTDGATAVQVATWFPADLLVSLAQAGNREPAIASLVPQLSSNDPAARSSAYPLLITTIRRSARRDVLLPELAPVVEALLVRDPDRTSQQALCSALAETIPAIEGPFPAASEDFELAYWSAQRLAQSLIAQQKSSPQRAAMAEALRESVGLTTPAGEGLTTAKIEELVTTRIYGVLVAAADKRPLEVVAMEKKLQRRAAISMSPAQLMRLRLSVLAAVASKVQGNSVAARELAIGLTETADPITLLELARLRDEVVDIQLREAWGEALARRAGLTTTPPDRELTAAVRSKLAASAVASSTTSGDHATAIRLLAEEHLRLLPAPGEFRSDTDLAGHLAKLTSINTMLLALAGGPATQPLAKEWLTEFTSGDVTAEPDIFAASLPPPAAGNISTGDKRTFDRYFGQLADHRTLQPQQRPSILRGIAQLAPQVDELTSRQATIVVDYLLGERAMEEHVATLEPLGVLRRYKSLRLQLADQLTTREPTKIAVPTPILEEVISTLVGPQGEPFRWSLDAAAIALKQSVVDDLASSSARPQTSSQDAAAMLIDHLETKLIVQYRHRAVIAGVPATLAEQAPSPGDVLLLALDAQLISSSAASVSSYPSNQQLQKEIAAAEYLATSDLSLTVLLSEIWLTGLARQATSQLPAQAAEISRRYQEHRSQPSPKLAVEQLLRVESTASDILLLYLP